jgi:hypothetical protein
MRQLTFCLNLSDKTKIIRDNKSKVTKLGVAVTPAVEDMETMWPEFRSTNSGRNSSNVQNCENTFT